MSSSEGKYGSVVPGSNRLISAINRYCGWVILRATILTMCHYSIVRINVNHKYRMRIILISLIALALSACKVDMPKMAAEKLSGTVLIVATGSDKPNDKSEGGGIGTGFFVEDNLIVTNNHVITGASEIRVIGYKDTKPYAAKVIATDELADLAIMKLIDWDDFKTHINPTILEWGDSRKLMVGDSVWSMGNPYGLDFTVAQGLVSHKLRLRGKNRSFFIQTTTQIMPGNSGGPLMDMDGEVVAVNSAIVGREGYFGMAIPSAYARKIVMDLKQQGKVDRAKMGLRLDDADDQHGIKVKGIETASTAIAAGLLPNDKITAVRTAKTNGRFIEIYDSEALISEAMMLNTNDKIELEILRDGHHRVFAFEALAVSEP